MRVEIPPNVEDGRLANDMAYPRNLRIQNSIRGGVGKNCNKNKILRPKGKKTFGLERAKKGVQMHLNRQDQISAKSGQRLPMRGNPTK